MGKPKNDASERFKSFDVMLPQGARSRFDKAMRLIDHAEDLLPADALAGDSASLRQAIKDLQEAATNLAELMVYRKMMGVD
jgi:hypothetical protein